MTEDLAIAAKLETNILLCVVENEKNTFALCVKLPTFCLKYYYGSQVALFLVLL